MFNKLRWTSIIAAALLAFAAPALAKGGPGGGGGGGGGGGSTLTAPPDFFLGVDAGTSFSFGVAAQFKDSAPTVTVISAPAGVIVDVSTLPPARGGPWTTSASITNWIPTRDQIGQQTVVFEWAAPGQTPVRSSLIITVFDSPTPVTGLTATVQGGSIVVSWNPSQFGASPTSYRVSPCINISGNSRATNLGETCYRFVSPGVTTTATTVTFPSTLPDPSGAPLPINLVEVTPFGADGVQGGSTVIVPSAP